MINMVRKIFSYWKSLVIILTPLLLALLFVISTSKEMRCAYVIMVMAVYWVTEPIPIPVTSLIPVFACPLLGILSSKEICSAYMNETNMMFLGSLVVAIAVEYSNLHRRIAYFTVLKIGQSPRQLMAGFMLTTMFLSMWISNTASTAMMIPIVDAILQELYMTTKSDTLEVVTSNKNGTTEPVGEPLEDLSVAPLQQSQTDLVYSDSNESSGYNVVVNESSLNGKITMPLNDESRSLKNLFFLATAYAANIGGTGSLIGTPPNLVVKGVLDSSFSEPSNLNFASWTAFNVPGMLLCTACGWLWLQFWFIGVGKWSRMPKSTQEQEKKIRQLIRKKYDELGRFTFHEMTVLFLFVFQAILWFFREPEFMNGWGYLFDGLFNKEINVGDSVPALLVVFALFAIPAKPNFGWLGKKFGCDQSQTTGPSTRCLTWDIVHKKMPWGIIILLGGGFALADAASSSGLSFLIGEKLRVLAVLPPAASVFIVSMATAMATEVTSNTAIASLLMPTLKDLSLAICVNPLVFMLPAAVCCSYAFMLPVATPPNALVYDAAKMKTKDMMKVGFSMNIICVVIINIMVNTLGVSMFDIYHVPSWANSSTSEYVPNC